MQSKETLEEAFECFKKEYPILKNYNLHHLLQVARFGAKWQAKRSYSEEEVIKIIQECKSYLSFGDEFDEINWFEQFKKK
jgi:hypothetical protein